MADAWEEHKAAVKEILDKCGEALRGPTPGEMTYTEFRAELMRLQRGTSRKLGKVPQDFAPRFAEEEAQLKRMCGL